MATVARSKVDFSALVEKLTTELKEEQATPSGERALAGRHFRVLRLADLQAGTNLANAYANQALLVQTSKLLTLLNWGIAFESALLPANLQNELNVALSTLGLQINPLTPSKLEEVAIPEDVQEAQKDYKQGSEFKLLTETVASLRDLNAQKGLLQSTLRVELARTAAYIKVFFSNIENKDLDQDAIDILQHVFAKMNLALGIRQTPHHQAIIKDIALEFYIQDTVSEQYPFVDENFTEECFAKINTVIYTYATADAKGFDVNSFNQDKSAGRFPEKAIAYVESILQETQVNEDGICSMADITETVKQDMQFIAYTWGPGIDHPLYMIEELVQSYMKQVEWEPGSATGKLYTDAEKTQHYEITAAKAPLQLANVLFKMIEEAILGFSSNGTSPFDLVSCLENLQGEGYSLLRLYLEELTKRMGTDSTLLIEELHFQRSKINAFYLKQIQEKTRSQPGFLRRHAGKVLKTATAVAGAAAAYAYLLPFLL